MTIEHILPQSPQKDSQWMAWFEGKEPEKYVHKIGNLTLLSHRKNSKAKNYEFDVKKEKYFSSQEGVSSFVLTTQVLQQAEWTPEVIERRQLKSLETLETLWRL